MDFAKRFADGRQLQHPRRTGVVREVRLPEPLRLIDGLGLLDLFAADEGVIELGDLVGPQPVGIRMFHGNSSKQICAVTVGHVEAATRWEVGPFEPDELSTFALCDPDLYYDLAEVALDIAGDPPAMYEPVSRSIFDGSATVVWLDDDCDWLIHQGYDDDDNLVCVAIDLGVLWVREPLLGQVPIDPLDTGPVRHPWLDEIGVDVHGLPTPFPGHVLSVEVAEPDAVTMRFVHPDGRALIGAQTTERTDAGWELRLQSPTLQTGPVHLLLEFITTPTPV